MRDTLAQDEHAPEHSFTSSRPAQPATGDQPEDGAAPPTDHRNGATWSAEQAEPGRAGRGSITVALVNDYELVVRGLEAMLAPFSDRVTVVDLAVDEPGSNADIALFDTFAARRDALDRARHMIEDETVGHVVLFTWDAPEGFVDQAASIGVDGVISKTSSAAELVDALERVARGERVGLDAVVKGERSRQNGTDLTAREQEVLALLAHGKSNSEIAHELFLSVDTIKTHVRRVFTKLGVNNRTQAAMRAVDPRNGLLRSGSDSTRPS